ncbi:sensor histidine kinase [Streptomyces virginiae]|uniref:sensor histidine kinase n=1 Tax=Streptomyces virginiae TaxID=1961 RepID=UPI00344CC61A
MRQARRSNTGPVRRGPRVLAVVPALTALLASAFAVYAISLGWGASPFWPWTDAFTQPVGLFFIVVGTVVAANQADGQRMGLLLMAMGAASYAWDLQFSHNPVVFKLGFAFFHLNGVILAHLLLAFPTGHLHSRTERFLIGTLYVTTPVIQGLRILSEHPLQPQLWGDPEAHYSIWAPVGSVVEIILTVAVLVVVLTRWRAESPAARRARGVYWSSVAAIGVVAAAGGVIALLRAPVKAQGAFLLGYAFAMALLGVAALLGPVRSLRAHRQMTVALAGMQSTRDLQARLALALDDPNLVLAYRNPDTGGYEGVHGDLPLTQPHGDGRVVAYIGDRESPVAVLVHDRFLAEYPQNERLTAAVTVAELVIGLQTADRAHQREVKELQAARLAAVEAVELDTRRAFRMDLHDRVQHLVTYTQAQVGEAQRSCADPETSRRLDDIKRRLQTVAAALRDVADGMFPPDLEAEGLNVALMSFEPSSAVTPDRHDPTGNHEIIPTPEIDVPEERWPLPLEFAIYNIATEAIGNAHKHAKAARIRVYMRQIDRHLFLEISDDGVGGAKAKVGHSGLHHMRARAEARGGTFDIADRSGGGTTIKVVLPCE